MRFDPLLEPIETIIVQPLGPYIARYCFSLVNPHHAPIAEVQRYFPLRDEKVEVVEPQVLQIYRMTRCTGHKEMIRALGGLEAAVLTLGLLYGLTLQPKDYRDQTERGWQNDPTGYQCFIRLGRWVYIVTYSYGLIPNTRYEDGWRVRGDLVDRRYVYGRDYVVVAPCKTGT